MTARDDVNGVISEWLDEQAGRGAPDYLDEVLSRTTRTRQRPAWSSLERWLPMQMTFSGRLAPIPRLVWFAALIAILALAAAALLAAGVGQRRLPHFGSAANGQIAFIDGMTLKVAGPDGANIRVASTLPSAIESLRFSPDGTRLAYRTTGTPPGIIVADADGSHPIVVASGPDIATGGPIAWSPDSRRLAFTSIVTADTGTIEVTDVDGSHPTKFFPASTAKPVDRFDPAWSPDGQWIAFFSSEPNGSIALNAVHPDGAGAQRLPTSPMNPDIIDASWSPDPAQRRLVYVAGANVDLFDMTTGQQVFVGTGFWPTWSPDGRRIAWNGNGAQAVDVAALLAGNAKPVQLFPPYGSGHCQEHPEAAGKVICGPAQWSPDGAWVYAHDVLGASILIAHADGSGGVRTIALQQPADLTKGPLGELSWQPVAP